MAPYGKTVYLCLKNCHFSFLQKVPEYSSCDKEINERVRVDWFDMKSTRETTNTKQCISEGRYHTRMKDKRFPRQLEERKQMIRTQRARSNILGEQEERKLTGNIAIKRVKEGDDTVTNLSSCKLTVEQTELLSKGLKFIPNKTKVDKIKLLSDLTEWERRMRLREYFFEKEKMKEEKEEKEDPQVKNHS